MTARSNIQYLLLACLVSLGGTMAHAQGRPGGGGPGGGMGPGMGGPRGGEMAARMPMPRIRTEPQLSLPGRWWDDKKTVKTLNLRSEQQHRMDDIFNAGKGNLGSLFDTLQREQQKFVSMSHEDLEDETKVFAAIDRIAQARAELEKANFHLLLQIRNEMDSNQRSALDHEISSTQ